MRNFEIFVNEESSVDIAEGLYRIEGLEVRFTENNVMEPDPNRKHGFYCATWAELVPIIVSTASVIGGLLSLATAIISLRVAKSQKSENNNPVTKMIIVINGHSKEIEENTDPEALCRFMENQLTDE